jgi:NTE family protein
VKPVARQSLGAAIQQLFAVPGEDVAAVLAELEPRLCRGGDWLFRQGDAGDALYLLARGRMEVWISQEPSGESQEQLVAEVAPGETIGEIGLLTGSARSASIRAVRDSLLLRMDTATFDRLARESPRLIRGIAGGIASRLRDRTAGDTRRRRRYRTIALLPLDGSVHSDSLADDLADAMDPHGHAVVLNPTRLVALGAPPAWSCNGGEASADMLHWLADVEDDHELVLFVADPGDTAWTRLALRHADLVLLVADAGTDPGQRTWEVELLDAGAGPSARRALLLMQPPAPAGPAGTSRWLQPRRLDFHLHLRRDSRADLERVARVLSGRSLGLVLGGGAARGFAHLGVYRALAEHGMPVDWFGGASIGAVMAAAMATGMTPDEVIEAARASFVGGKPFGDFTVPVLALLRGRRMEHLIREQLDTNIENLPLPFFCVSSNLGLGRLQVHDRGDLPRALRASVSLPGVFPAAVVNGELTIDGGILDNLPVDEMLRRPVGRVIAVDLTSPRPFTVDYDAVPSPWAVLAGRFLPFARRRRVPGFMSLMLKATEIGTMEKVAASGRRADLLIKPPVSGFGITDVRSFDRIVDAGYAHTKEVLAGRDRT